MWIGHTSVSHYRNLVIIITVITVTTLADPKKAYEPRVPISKLI